MVFVSEPVVSLAPILGGNTLFWNRLWLLGSICKALPLLIASYKFSLFFKTQAQHESNTEAALVCAGKFQSPACAWEEVRSPHRNTGFKASAVPLPSQHFSKYSRGISVVGIRKPWTSEDCLKLPYPTQLGALQNLEVKLIFTVGL